MSAAIVAAVLWWSPRATVALQQIPCAAISGPDRPSALIAALRGLVFHAESAWVHRILGRATGFVLRRPQLQSKVASHGDGADVEVAIISADNMHDAVIVGLAGRDSVCYAGRRGGLDWGLDARPGSLRSWNAALGRVSPSFTVSDADEARSVAVAALSFITGVAFEPGLAPAVGRLSADAPVVGTTAQYRVDSQWAVNGWLTYVTSHLFRMRLDSAGRLVELYIEGATTEPLRP